MSRKDVKLSDTQERSGQSSLLGRQEKSRISGQRSQGVMYSRNHQLYHFTIFITTKIANVCRMLCAKHCSKALYVLIHLIPPKTP